MARKRRDAGEKAPSPTPKVGVIMGSQSDWNTMSEAVIILNSLGIESERRVVSAHRTPDLLYEYARTAQKRGLKVIIAGAGGAAHLPGMVASMTMLPVFGVPINTSVLGGMDSLLSIVQMPMGVPVGTLAIGTAGAQNAALLAARVIALWSAKTRKKLAELMAAMTSTVLNAKFGS